MTTRTTTPPNETRSVVCWLLCATAVAFLATLGGCRATDGTGPALPELPPQPSQSAIARTGDSVNALAGTVRRPASSPGKRKIQREFRPCEDNEFRLRDLEIETMRIANQDVRQMLQVLTTLGYETVSIPSLEPPDVRDDGYGGDNQDSYGGGYDDGQGEAGGLAKRYGCDRLPVIVMPPPVNDSRLGFSAADFLGLASGSEDDRYSDEGSSAAVRGDMSAALHNLSKPHSGEVDNLLVFYHPENTNELRELQSLVRNQLDVEASQIYIEGLVLEVSEDGLLELGMQYDRIDPDNSRAIGLGALRASPVAVGGAPVFDVLRDTLMDASITPDQILLQIQALVSTGAAEVLSRPSVLTLNNRQATIQIIDIVQFPIQEATITDYGNIVQSAFSFEAVRPGITLNLRPRVSADQAFVSLEIDVTVEALVTANNGEVRNDEGQVIATKPGSSARRVQTFARIPDRTPIIIGGLISTDRETVSNKTPFLGKIPLLGNLFGANRKINSKREVIIVLTPHVVSEGNMSADVSMPKDTSLFDITDSTLFLDSYRIRSEDVYDLNFLLDSPEFTRYQEVSEHVQESHPDLANDPPFSHFLNGNIPGGDKFLNRMVFDLVRRREFGAEIDADQLIVLRNTPSGTPEVALISNLFKQVEESENKALVIVFGRDAEGGVDQAAELWLTTRPDGKTWDELLWDLSYGNPDGLERAAAIVRGEEDLKTLLDATISAAVLDRNGGHDKLSVGRFRQGTMLSIPNFEKGRFYLVDDKVARVFTDVRHYYRAAAMRLDRTYREMDGEMPYVLDEDGEQASE